MPTYSYSYSFPYILVFLFLIALSILENKSSLKERKFFGYVSLLIFVSFVGFRGYIGWDWFSYHELFESIGALGSANVGPQVIDSKQVLSPGFIITIKVFKLFSSNYLLYSTCLTLISGLFFYNFFEKYNVNKSFGFALLITFALNIQIDLLRNNLALLLFLYSIHHLNNRNLKKYVIINLIGATIHLSSLTFIPLYFIIHRNLNNLTTKVVLGIGAGMYFLQVGIADLIIQVTSLFSSELASKFRIYSSIESYLTTSINYEYFFVKMVLAIFIFMKYNDIAKKDKRIIPFLNLALFNIFAFLYFSGFSVLQTRFQILFVLSFLIAIPYLLEHIKMRVLAYSIFISFQIISIGIRYKVILFQYENYVFKESDIYKRKSIFNNHAYIINPLQTETSSW